MRRYCFFIGILCVNVAFSQGFRDTIIHLKEVTKRSTIKFEVRPIAVNDFVRVEAENKGVTEWLKKTNSFFIKNYGQGGLASIAYRGTSAAQNEVYWNGIKINSPFTGQVDGNLLLINPNQDLRLSSSSNAIGSRISMLDDYLIEQGVAGNFLIRYTTLNSVDLSGSVNYKGKHLYSYTNASTVYAKNNYRIPNGFVKGDWKKQTHNALSMTNIKTTLGYKFNDKQDISASVWWSRNNREIAPLLYDSKPAMQTQYDRALRALLNYKGEVKNLTLTLRTSALSEVLNYRDESSIGLYSHSQSLSSRNEAALNYNFAKYKIQTEVAAKYDYEQGIFDSFSRDRHIAELRQRIVFKNRFFSAEATAFQTIFRHQAIPTFAILAQYHFRKKSIEQQLSLSAARILRVPSMNDLYYPLSGNLNLKPETGWKGDVSWKMNHDYFQTKLTVYGQYATNWIQWSPTSSTFWTPQNLKRVYGCGTEVFASAGWFEKTSRKWFGYFVSSYSWNRAINMDKISANDASDNKQLIYVPVHKTYTALRGGWRGFSASLDYTYFSKIYTATDNSQALNGYGLMDLHISKMFRVSKQEIIGSFGIYNLLDTQYQTMPQRAMPGRYYEVLLRFNLRG